jgi:tRNA threonylcarbamoyladenosine biosynthesis protein TsaB
MGKMPRALAIETSGRTGSVALLEGATVLEEQTFEHGLKHAAGILPMIDRLCSERGWGPRGLDELYVSAGPGSFTGLRIGITLAKTLALAAGVKLVAVPSVRVLVENAPADARNVIIVLDAKRDQIFTARFERSSEDQPWREREPARLDSLRAMLDRSPRPVHLLGEGIPYHLRFISQDSQVIVTPEETWRASARAVGRIGSQLAQAGQYTDPDRLTPIYIRKPEAEEKWEQRGKSGISSLGD